MVLNRRSFLKASLGGLLLPHTVDEAAASGLQYVVTDPDGKVLDGYASQTKRHPASLTKMMTLYCVMAAMKDPSTKFNLDSIVEIPEIISLIGKGIAVFDNVKAGQKYPAGKLMTGAGSRSDAYCTLALAVHLGSENVYDWGGSEGDKLKRFIKLMNETAQSLGMKDTRFSVCTGLPAANHYSTPRDIAILVRALHEEFPKSTELALGQPKFNIRPLSNAHKNSSKILRKYDDTVLFAKTGWTNDAGYCLAVMAEIDGRKNVAVIFGADNDAHRNLVMEKLLGDMRHNVQNVPTPSARPT